MKVYTSYRFDYEDTHTIGMFSSREKAEESNRHHYANYLRETALEDGQAYYSFRDYGIEERNLDEYYNTHLSPLSKALE